MLFTLWDASFAFTLCMQQPSKRGDSFVIWVISQEGQLLHWKLLQQTRASQYPKQTIQLKKAIQPLRKQYKPFSVRNKTYEFFSLQQYCQGSCTAHCHSLLNWPCSTETTRRHVLLFPQLKLHFSMPPLYSHMISIHVQYDSLQYTSRPHRNISRCIKPHEGFMRLL